MTGITIRREWGLVLFGGIFLCNPIVGFVDLLPDALGLLLIVLGLYRVADLDHHLSHARRGFSIMLGVAVGQLLAFYFIFGMLGQAGEDKLNAYERPMLILLGSLAYAFFVLYFLLPALRSLFRGVESLAIRTEGEVTAAALQEGRTSGERMARRTVLFLLVQMLAAILPELSILTSLEMEAGNPLFPFDWHRFVPLFRMAVTPIALGFAVWYLVGFCRFFATLRRADAWNRALLMRWQGEIGNDQRRMERRRYLVFSILVGVGFLFSLRLKLNHLTVLPSIVAALALWSGLRLMRDRLPAPAGRLPFLLLGGSSLLQVLLNRSYLHRFDPEASRYLEAAYLHFGAMRIAELLEAVLLLWVHWTLLSALSALVRQNLKVCYEGDPAASRRATERLQHRLLLRIRFLRIGGILLCLGNLVYALFQLYLPWMWFVNLLLWGVEGGMLLSFRSEYLEEMHFYDTEDA